jgi:hypothetical protein
MMKLTRVGAGIDGRRRTGYRTVRGFVGLWTSLGNERDDDDTMLEQEPQAKRTKRKGIKKTFHKEHCFTSFCVLQISVCIESSFL